jgi:peptidoglycan L-alanyl-D-glutamate endopeptidase CwlK
MKKYGFGKESLSKLATCHDDLQTILQAALEYSMIDFGISEGARSIERQNELYKQGKSQIDGIIQKGMHNYFPSLAADIFVASQGIDPYDVKSLCYIAGVVQSTALALYDNGVVKNIIRWGGNWDMDGVIIKDQTFQDLCHFELYSE